ncbi:MAG: LacI family DNA-binding transcriptional regulator [Niabella sp.]
MSAEKEVTIYDLADTLKISVATVSRALNDSPVVNEKTKKKVFDLAEKMGYRANHFASNLRTKHTNTIGFLVHELNSNFITSVLSGVEKTVSEAGYDLIIAHSSESYQKEVANARNLFNKRIDGLIASLSFDTNDISHFSPFINKGIPVVFFDRVEKIENAIVVVIDNYKCGYDATMHLINQGCKKIAHVTSSLTRNVYSERYRGYRNALLDSGIEVDENLVLVNDLSEKAGVDSAKKILKMEVVPDGVFITNDFVAASFIKTIKENGWSVPKDIAVVGFNNDAIAHLIEPALTTINYPGKEMGEVAAKALVDHLKNLTSARNISTVIVNSNLIIRESSIKKKSRGNPKR